MQVLDRNNVRTIDRYGGTHLHTSRTNPQRVRQSDMPAFLAERYPIPEGQKSTDCTPHVLSVIEHLGLDAIIAIGGDDTLSYALRLHREGVKVVGIPKTMDNDVHGTDYCIGFSTAVTRSVDLINSLRTPTGSHERIAVVELFGRNSGETSLVSAYLADVDRALISEVPFDIERLAKMVVEDRRRNPSRYAIITVSEGATMIGSQVIEYGQEDAYGHKKLGGIGVFVGDALKHLTGHRHRQPAARLPDAGGGAGLARPDGGDVVRAAGSGIARRGGGRANGGAARGRVHDRADRDIGHGNQACGHRRALRRGAVPAEGGAPAGEADVLVLARGLPVYWTVYLARIRSRL